MTDSSLIRTSMNELRAGVSMLDALTSAPKVTFFGSARTNAESTIAQLAYETAQSLAGRGWYVISGAGPGVMEAASRGAGSELAVGVDIDLPGEVMVESPGDVLHALTDTTYFFSRKVLLTRSANAFVALPGGFGTLDEIFEILNLLYTHKSPPVPIVLLDRPGGTYWQRLQSFLVDEVAGAGYANGDFVDAYTMCTSSADAVNAIVSFYANVKSTAFTDHGVAITTRIRPNEEQLDDLRETLDAPCLFDDAKSILYVTLRGRDYGRVRRAIGVVNSWR